MYNSQWYNSLTKPVFAPASSVFTPAWIFLYTTIIISLILFIFTNSEINKKAGYIYFSIQMILNIIWSPVFFGLQDILSALIIILFLDVFTVLTIIEFYKVSKIAGLVLIPYFLWLLFATYLNFGYLILN